MCVEVILHEANRCDVRIMDPHKLFQKKSRVNSRSLVPDMEDTPTSQRLQRAHHPASPLTLLLVGFTLRLPRLHRNRRQHITQQLAWPCVKTPDWRQWIIWWLVTVQNIRHMPDRVSRDVPSTPTLD
jgi:hypothetical protein